MKKIIVPTGYMGSGSSAITDLISEFKDCQNDFGAYEYVFLHCPNGLFDLEDKLLYGNNVIRSDEAIRSFELQMNKLYSKKFWWVGNYKKIIGKNFKKITDDYINDITQFNHSGYYYMHEEVNFKMFIKLLLLKPFKMLFKKVEFPKVLKYKDGIRLSFVNEKEFYKKSHDYIYSIVQEISKGKENVILDQFLLPHNLFRIDNYFDKSLKVIVVERDPRDVFVINKYVWSKKGLSLPFPLEVNEFCDFYDKMRKSERIIVSDSVLRVKFEDLIYNYEDVLKKVKNFMSFKDKEHINKMKKFDPNKSIINTQIFRNQEYENEIKIIEEKLGKYLYQFPYLLENDANKTVEFDLGEGE